MMRRRDFLASLAAGAAPGGARPNLLFILADDLGWADTTPYGADLHETPAIERLARAGVRFTHAYAAAPVCSPTRASIHTGLYPARLHMTTWRESAHTDSPDTKLIPAQCEENLPRSPDNLAERLRAAGYFTAHVGKWHLGDAHHYPEAQGFDVNIGGTEWGAPQTYFSPYSGNRYYGGEYRYVPGLSGGRPGEYLTDRLTTKALEVLDTRPNQPFFLNLCFHNPHTPIEAKPEVVEHFRARMRVGQRHKNPVYAAMVRTLDDNVGRVLDYLDRKRLAANTLVVFTSDNGGVVNAWQRQFVTDNFPLRSGKGALYEGGLRVPLMARGPGVAAGVCTERVISNDLYPTLLEFAGASRKVDGMSLAPLLRHPGARLNRKRLYFHYPHYYPTTTPVSAVIGENHKLLRYWEDMRLELYDLDADPGELHNVAAQRADLRDRLAHELDAWLTGVRAQLPQRRPAQ